MRRRIYPTAACQPEASKFIYRYEREINRLYTTQKHIIHLKAVDSLLVAQFKTAKYDFVKIFVLVLQFPDRDEYSQ